MKVADLAGLDALLRRADNTEHGALISSSPLLPSVVVSPPVQAVGMASAAVVAAPPAHVVGRIVGAADGTLGIVWRDGSFTSLRLAPVK